MSRRFSWTGCDGGVLSRMRPGRVGLIAAMVIGMSATGMAVAQAAVETTATAGLGCGGWMQGILNVTGLPPNSQVQGHYGEQTQWAYADENGAARINMGSQDFEVGDDVHYNIVLDEQTVADGSVEVTDVCADNGTFIIARDCANPALMALTVALSGAPAGELIDVWLLGDDGFYFTESGWKGNPGISGSLTVGMDGNFSGTIQLSPGRGSMSAVDEAFTGRIMLGAVDYNHADVVDQSVPVPACTTAPRPVTLTTMQECMKGGWATSPNPTFRNQGDCVRYFAAKALECMRGGWAASANPTFRNQGDCVRYFARR